MFNKLTDGAYASPQIAVEDVARASSLGITLIINNRPEGESSDQAPGEAIERAARAAGLAYVAIPVSHAGFSEWQVRAMVNAMATTDGPLLAYCRSGTRSTLLWALAEADRGRDPAWIAAAAEGAGYDIAPIRGLVEVLAAKRGERPCDT